MIQIKDLCVSYDKLIALKNVCCSFDDFGLTVIMGANGSGKSTFLRAVAGLIPYDGEIFLNGKNTKEYTRREFCAKLAFLPQLKELASLSVETLISHGRFPHLKFPRVLSKADKAIVDEVIESLSLSDLRKRNLLEISGGERQRAYIGMALCQQTEILLLDEPTVSLDAPGRREILRLIKTIAEKKTVVLVHHDLSEALEFADRLAVFGKSELIAVGNTTEILNSKALEKAFNAEIVLKEEYKMI